MGREDWYRSTTWTLEIEAAFEARLARSRGAFHKAQYLRIQALYLLDSMDQSCQRAGVQLMQRLIAEYPDEWTQVVSAHELLGNYYRSQGQVAEAEREYRKVLEFYRRSRSCTSGLCDLSLVELILESNQAHKYSEAWQLLQSIPQHLGSFGFNSDRFRYRVAAARLAMRVGNTENAKAHAREALELAQITKPQFSRHPAIGLVKAEPAVLSEMQTILSR